MRERFIVSSAFTSRRNVPVCLASASKAPEIFNCSDSEGNATGKRPTIDLFKFSIVCPTAWS